MTKHVPIIITAGQIGKVQDLVGAALRKSNLPGEWVQQILESQGGALADAFVSMVRERVEMISNLIIRRVVVTRTRTPQQALDATGRVQYTDRKVVDVMPKGEGDETEVVFFKPDLSSGGSISDDDLEKEFELHGLKPADPVSLAAVNEADPAFADNHPNGTHWKDADGNWCYATFYRWRGGRSVDVGRNDHGWNDDWWFAGRRK